MSDEILATYRYICSSDGTPYVRILNRSEIVATKTQDHLKTKMPDCQARNKFVMFISYLQQLAIREYG